MTKQEALNILILHNLWRRDRNKINPYEMQHPKLIGEAIDFVIDRLSKFDDMRFADVTRLEVIDANGRSYTNWKCKDIKLSFQDDDRTLKIFTN